eukprot:366436-Chlamydomonas_euryale.AAC.36
MATQHPHQANEAWLMANEDTHYDKASCHVLLPSSLYRSAQRRTPRGRRPRFLSHVIVLNGSRTTYGPATRTQISGQGSSCPCR